MKTVSLSGSPRENVGKKDAKALRKENLVPCVLYGGKEQIHFATDERNFQKVVFTPEVCFIEIDLAGKKYSAILQDIQYHPVNDKILHADFLELTGKPIKLDVPVRLIGTSPGVLKGGKLALKHRKLPVKSLPDNMPQEIIVSINDLEIGDKVKVSEVKSENFSILLTDNTVIVMIMKARGAEAGETEVEAAAEA